VPLALQIFQELRNTEPDADAAIRVGRLDEDESDPRRRSWRDEE
jgi:hypothetical protein